MRNRIRGTTVTKKELHGLRLVIYLVVAPVVLGIIIGALV